MGSRITHLWAKPLGTWTLVDLVCAVLVVSLVSLASGYVLGVMAVIPAAVARDWRRGCKTEARFEHD